MRSILSRIVLAILVLNCCVNVNAGPVSYGTCMGTCMGVAWFLSIPLVGATGGGAAPVLAAAYAGAGAGLKGTCLTVCMPLLAAPSP